MEHKTQEDIQLEIDKALTQVSVGTLYYHFKTPEHRYVIEFVGCLESSEEVCIGYRALYGQGILWIRTLQDFLSEKEVEGKMVKRFIKLNS